MTINLSKLVDLMYQGGIYDQVTGKAESLNAWVSNFEREHQTGENLYKNDALIHYHPDRYIYIPCINQEVVLKEFVKMQYFNKKLSHKIDDLMALDDDIIIPLHELYNYVSESNNFDDIYSYIDFVGMEHMLEEYTDMRIAGLARKWGRDNNIDIEEDYRDYIIGNY